jgi:hypothetical protein
VKHLPPTEMDEALEADPPYIHWEPNGKGVLVGTVLHDPHAEKQWRRNDDRPRRRSEAS